MYGPMDVSVVRDVDLCTGGWTQAWALGSCMLSSRYVYVCIILYPYVPLCVNVCVCVNTLSVRLLFVFLA